ncbi:MAG: trehalose-phosphatase [Candidatus Omnitrophica bacterium]|nr:trehalose-phosphatase [Candidatus Omnitrophota bacterium]
MKPLLRHWKKIKQQLECRPLFLFLDYDGTLAPIAATPGQAQMAKETRALLATLSKAANIKIAIMSGRSLKDVQEKVGLKNIIYSGNHGLEIEGPQIAFASLVAPAFKKILLRIYRALKKKTATVKGVLIEDKGFSLSVHYRLVDKAKIPMVKKLFHDEISTYLIANQVAVKTGKMVLEIRPPLAWHKGKAVLWLLTRQRFALCDDAVMPIYVGDDVSDEDAFKALHEQGLTVFVGRQKASSAQYFLHDTREVTEFLKRINALRKE